MNKSFKMRQSLIPCLFFFVLLIFLINQSSSTKNKTEPTPESISSSMLGQIGRKNGKEHSGGDGYSDDEHEEDYNGAANDDNTTANNEEDDEDEDDDDDDEKDGDDDDDDDESEVSSSYLNGDFSESPEIQTTAFLKRGLVYRIIFKTEPNVNVNSQSLSIYDQVLDLDRFWGSKRSSKTVNFHFSANQLERNDFAADHEFPELILLKLILVRCRLNELNNTKFFSLLQKLSLPPKWYKKNITIPIETSQLSLKNLDKIQIQYRHLISRLNRNAHNAYKEVLKDYEKHLISQVLFDLIDSDPDQKLDQINTKLDEHCGLYYMQLFILIGLQMNSHFKLEDVLTSDGVEYFHTNQVVYLRKKSAQFLNMKWNLISRHDWSEKVQKIAAKNPKSIPKLDLNTETQSFTISLRVQGNKLQKKLVHQTSANEMITLPKIRKSRNLFSGKEALRTAQTIVRQYIDFLFENSNKFKLTLTKDKLKFSVDQMEAQRIVSTHYLSQEQEFVQLIIRAIQSTTSILSQTNEIVTEIEDIEKYRLSGWAMQLEIANQDQLFSITSVVNRNLRASDSDAIQNFDIIHMDEEKKSQLKEELNSYRQVVDEFERKKLSTPNEQPKKCKTKKKFERLSLRRVCEWIVFFTIEALNKIESSPMETKEINLPIKKVYEWLSTNSLDMNMAKVFGRVIEPRNLIDYRRLMRSTVWKVKFVFMDLHSSSTSSASSATSSVVVNWYVSKDEIEGVYICEDNFSITNQDLNSLRINSKNEEESFTSLSVKQLASYLVKAMRDLALSKDKSIEMNNLVNSILSSVTFDSFKVAVLGMLYRMPLSIGEQVAEIAKQANDSRLLKNITYPVYGEKNKIRKPLPANRPELRVWGNWAALYANASDKIKNYVNPLIRLISMIKYTPQSSDQK